MKNILLFLTLLPSFLSSSGQVKKWHDLEGYFHHGEMYVKFTAQDTMLVANAIWNGAVIHLLPDTGLAFVSKETDDGDHIRIDFLRNPSGAVDQFRLAGKEVWERAKDYKPVVKQEMAHTPEQLQKFAGLYHYREDTGQYVQLAVENNSLTIHQLWDGGSIAPFVPESETLFFLKDRPNATLSFSHGGSGEITQFVAFGRDTWLRAATTLPSAVQLKGFEGKFRSVDDSDNLVQLISDGSDIIVRELWNKKEIRLQALTPTFFNDEKYSFPLHVILDNGHVSSIILLGNERFIKVGL